MYIKQQKNDYISGICTNSLYALTGPVISYQIAHILHEIKSQSKRPTQVTCRTLYIQKDQPLAQLINKSGPAL